jgi:hypothetical protein
MAITGLNSVFSTVGEFAAHWAQAEAVLGAPILLAGGYALAKFREDGLAFEAQLQTVGLAEVQASAARGVRHATRRTVRGRLRQYRYAVRAALPGSSLAREMPGLPQEEAADGSFLTAIGQFCGHWAQVNAALGASPLVLIGGYGLAELRAAYDTLENQVMEMSALIEAARAGRGERDAMIAALIERMVQYQNAAAAALGENRRWRR